MSTTTNTNPVFTKKGIFNTGQILLAANTAKDGTGTVITVFDPQRAIASITSSGIIATATSTLPHGFLNGEEILITGATETGYNGVKTITLTGAKSFTYEVTNGLSTPATGTILADPINGCRIEKLVFQPTGTTTNDTVARIFLNNGQTNGTAANNTYLDDVALPIMTLTEVAAMDGTEKILDIVVPPFHKINCTLGTVVTPSGFAVYAVAGGY